jgi:L-cysteine/cystine lyase
VADFCCPDYIVLMVERIRASWVPKAGARRFDTGFTPPNLTAGLEAALMIRPTGRFERARELTERCRKLLIDHGHDIVTEAGQATLVSWRHDGDTDTAARRLYERGVIIRELPGTGLLRASIGWWNDGSDLERLAEGLEDLKP